MDTTPNIRYQKRMGFAREGQKTGKLHIKFFGHHDLDWDMPELVEVEAGEIINGEPYAYLWDRLKYDFTTMEKNYLFLSAMAECLVCAKEEMEDQSARFGIEEDIDAEMMNLFEVELGEPIIGMPFTYWKGILQMMGPLPSHRLLLLKGFMEDIVDQEDADAAVVIECRYIRKPNLRPSVNESSRRGEVDCLNLRSMSKVMFDLTSRTDSPDNWSVRMAKMHNRQPSRRRLVDEEIEAFEASILGRAPTDEGSDLKVLDVITEAPLSMVLSAGEVPIARRRRTILTEDSKEEETVGGRRARRPDSIEDETPSSKTGERSTKFLKGNPVQMNGNFNEMMRVIKGMNAKLSGEGRGLIKWFELLLPSTRRRRARSQSWNQKAEEEEGGFPASKRTRYAEAIEEKERQRYFEVSKRNRRGRVAKEFLVCSENAEGVKASNASARSGWRCFEIEAEAGTGEDDAVDKDEKMTEVERQEQAVAKQASMVKLCEDDLNEALKEIKMSMFQTNAWVRSYNKAIKSVKEKLRQAVESLDLCRGTEASLLSEVKKLKQDIEVITDSFDERLELQRSRHEREWLAKLAVKKREKVE
ncbi:hypothetical protein GIB67_039899 [Kingdonia uniflora]|uniref:Uncharacterized protein n=1 Tax=Kingdonia uniflora TaxID=39325 RepID=A0A7J7P452_9MAGN|nr:hypothetical protein GIB67_039899 [Kingdonia uniflora]